MANLSTHYKEREPEQTIEIIKNFFDKNELTIKITELEQSEASTWFCHLELYNKNIFIGDSNGKGVSKEYALASGHAELYERFCNSFFVSNPYWAKSLIDYNSKNYGYNFRKNEKILSINEQLTQVPSVEKFFSIFTDCDSLRDDMINYITDNKIIGLPYKSIDGKDTVYLDPRISVRLTHSVGMSAGNTEQEALVQGISEIIEHTIFYYVVTNPDKPLCAINLNSIKNPTLQNIIDNIHNCGYDLYLFDLSYTCGVPAMMSFLIDRKHGITNINFSSFPVFDIAAERVLTEIYQGIQSYNSKAFLGSVRTPYKLYNEPGYALRTYSNSIDGTIMSHELLEHIVWKDDYNHEVFLNKECNNNDCLNYLIDLTKKINLNLYFINNSLSDEVAAISIIDINKVVALNFNGFDIGISCGVSEGAMRKLIQQYSTIFNDIYNNTYNSLDFFELLNTQDVLDNYVGDNKTFILMWNYFYITEKVFGNFYMLNQVVNYDGNISYIPNELINTIFQNAFRKYYLLEIYMGTKAYKPEEYDAIFNKHFNFNVTDEDKENCFNKVYLLKKVYFDPLSEYIHSDDYLKIIKMFANK